MRSAEVPFCVRRIGVNVIIRAGMRLERLDTTEPGDDGETRKASAPGWSQLRAPQIGRWSPVSGRLPGTRLDGWSPRNATNVTATAIGPATHNVTVLTRVSLSDSASAGWARWNTA